MDIQVTKDQLIDVFTQFIADEVYMKVHGVTYCSVLNYMKRQYSNILDGAVSTAFDMYSSSEDIKEDMEYYDERRIDCDRE